MTEMERCRVDDCTAEGFAARIEAVGIKNPATLTTWFCRRHYAMLVMAEI